MSDPFGQPVFESLFVGHAAIEHCCVDREPVYGLAVLWPIRPSALDSKNRDTSSFSESREKQREMLQIRLALCIRNEPDIDVPLPCLRPISDTKVETIGIHGIGIPLAGVVAEDNRT